MEGSLQAGGWTSLADRGLGCRGLPDRAAVPVTAPLHQTLRPFECRAVAWTPSRERSATAYASSP